MKIEQMLGYKLFKMTGENEIDMIRIIKLKEYKGNKPDDPHKVVTIRHEGTGEKERVQLNELKDYTPLEPDGILTFNTVTVVDGCSDVIITASKFLNLKIKDTLPYAVCRQNITDIFYNLLCKDESDMIVGLSVNRDTCPANFDYLIMLSCKEIIHTDFVNFYRLDTLEDILDFINTTPYDIVLSQSYKEHVNATKNPTLNFKKEDKGWCKDLRTLLKENNFQEDINQMLGIVDINPIIENHIVVKHYPNGEQYTSLDNEFTSWLSSIFKLNITNITVLEYNHDINLAEFNNAKYLLLRDKTKKLYIVVYTSEGEYRESDLIDMTEKKDFSEEFRINFYNKYNQYK